MKLAVCALLLLTAQPALAQTPVPSPVPLPDDVAPLPKVIEAPPPPPPDEAPAPPAEKPPANRIKAPELSPPDSWVPRGAATLRVMNKIDSTVQTISVPVGGSVNFQSLTIKLAGCFVRPPDLPADAAAHLTITDNRPDQPGFDAWMLQNEPALNMLEHPVYDVQLAGCG